jgi:Fic family protein
MALLEESLILDIEDARERIDEQRLENFVDQMLACNKKDAILHASIQDKDNEARKEEVIDNFGKAWEFGKQQYAGEFTLLLLTDLAARVEPELKNAQGYADLRKGSTTVKNVGSCPGSAHVPPADEQRIRTSLDRMMSALNEMPMHPVEAAAYLYFHLVRIQPFDNSNKRTANLVMNLTLLYHGFPAISVLPRERFVFSSLLQGAITEFKSQGGNGNVDVPYRFPGEQQKAFFDYFAHKVLANLNAAEDKLKQVCRYEVDISCKNPGVLYAVKQKVSSWFVGCNRMSSVRLDARERKLYVTGDIKYEELSGLLNPFQKMKYKISTLRS